MSVYKHLSCEERDQIATFRAAGLSLSAIARAIGRSVSTISRELKRNCLPRGSYSARHADGAYLLRRQREGILEENEQLRTFVVQQLAEGWSPEQVSAWLKTGNERHQSLCPETIYSFIYRSSQKVNELWRYLGPVYK
ncbi:transposase [Flexibacterium corallicola]|uniref:transposase n=1 Tax=Flexibacterium corallicola TaxID=3037259 RepID=UPI0038621366